MYIAGLVIPVPEGKMEAYRRWAENGAQIFKEYGCLEIVECWEDNVPDGKQTDFRRAVAAEPGEKIVFTWQVWPDKAQFYAAEAKLHEDERLDTAGNRRSMRSASSAAASRRSFRWAGVDRHALAQIVAGQNQSFRRPTGCPSQAMWTYGRAANMIGGLPHGEKEFRQEDHEEREDHEAE